MSKRSSKRARSSAASAAGCASSGKSLAHNLNLSGISNPTRGPTPPAACSEPLLAAGCSAPLRPPSVWDEHVRHRHVPLGAALSWARRLQRAWEWCSSGHWTLTLPRAVLLVLSAGWREDTSPKFQKNPLSHLRQQSSRTPGGCLQLRTSRNAGIHPGTSTVSLGDREGLLLHCRSTWSRVGVPGGARQDANHGPGSKASKEERASIKPYNTETL